ncbi:MAG: anaerobic ribonucleoside-triphosphate reductase activating protein [Alphaproteobacteria bacterium]|nr:anaerobic ribonucleoside-triphosphate reductase activating protein [Alphaproteobacteria bacterium]
MSTVAGLVPFTSIDFPEHLAAVVFFKGCPLNCPFCHNPDLQMVDGQGVMSWQEVLQFLQTRQKRLDGAVFSGGEPLLQSDIVQCAQQVKQLGFKLGIHTSGVYPDKLSEILPYTDWVGLDVKAPWDKYDMLCGRQNIALKVQESLKILLDAGISFEARTTCDPIHLTPADIVQIASDLKNMGVPVYALQKYRTFPGDKNPPAQLAISAFFKPENLISVQNLYPNLIIR